MGLADLSLRSLDVVAMVHRHGAITAGAEASNLSQPAVSQAIAKTEAAIGRRLFVRHPGGMSPTPACDRLVIRIARCAASLSTGVAALRSPARAASLAHPLRWLTLPQLRAVTGTARGGSFALAARSLGLAQPSVHKAARDLERLLCVPMFLRQGRAISTTPATMEFVRFCGLALAELDAAAVELGETDAADASRVVIGAMPLSRVSILPQALSRFCAVYPKTVVSVIDGPYAELLAGLRSGAIDLLVGALRDPDPVPDIVQAPLFDDAPILVGRAGHWLEQLPPDLAALRRAEWIVARPDTPLRDGWDALFSPDPAPLPSIECGSAETIRALLIAGDWLSLMSEHQVADDLAAGRLVRIAAPLLGAARTIGVTTRRDWLPTPPQKALVAALSETIPTGET